jgi:uncharacterized protein with PQ loop repeat
MSNWEDSLNINWRPNLSIKKKRFGGLKSPPYFCIHKTNNVMETIGYLGGVLLAICGIPEVIRTIKGGTCHLGWSFLLLWFFGEFFMEIYAFSLKDFPLLFNYTFNLVLVGIMLYYKVKSINFYIRA